MSTKFLNAPPAGQPALTSALYSLRASTESPKVEVEIVRDPLGANDLLFSTALYPHDGIVELTDIGSIIEERFRVTARCWDTVTIRFEDASVTFIAVYCEYEMPPEFDVTECFLSASLRSVVHRNSAISITHWANESVEYQAWFVGLNHSGETTVVQRTLTRAENSDYLAFAVNDIIDLVLGDSDDSLASVSYFGISQGSLQKIFWLLEHPFFLTFGFRNIFNAYEYIDVTGIVTRKTNVSRESAICGGRVRQYNQTVERTFEVQTGPLTENQVRELEQLISSREIHLCCAGRDYDVIITDHTLESDNDDSALTSIKFTFRFATERPVLTSDDIDTLMPARHRIFTQEFTIQFV